MTRESSTAMMDASVAAFPQTPQAAVDFKSLLLAGTRSVGVFCSSAPY